MQNCRLQFNCAAHSELGIDYVLCYYGLLILQADAIMEKLRDNGMMKEILDSQETTLLITADQVCGLHLLMR